MYIHSCIGIYWQFTILTWLLTWPLPHLLLIYIILLSLLITIIIHHLTLYASTELEWLHFKSITRERLFREYNPSIQFDFEERLVSELRKVCKFNVWKVEGRYTISWRASCISSIARDSYQRKGATFVRSWMYTFEHNN